MWKNIIIGVLTIIILFLGYLYYSLLGIWQETNDELISYTNYHIAYQEQKSERVFDSFKDYDAIVLIDEETENDIKYKIILKAYDSIKFPDYRIYFRDTLSIGVDEEGNGFFTINKNNENHNNFQGDVILTDSEGRSIKVPYKYPNK